MGRVNAILLVLVIVCALGSKQLGMRLPDPSNTVIVTLERP